MDTFIVTFAVTPTESEYSENKKTLELKLHFVMVTSPLWIWTRERYELKFESEERKSEERRIRREGEEKERRERERRRERRLPKHQHSLILQMYIP